MTHKTYRGRWTAPGFIYIAVSSATLDEPIVTIKIGISKDPDSRYIYSSYAGIIDWRIIWERYDKLPAPIENTLCFKKLNHLRVRPYKELFRMTKRQVREIPAIIGDVIAERDEHDAFFAELMTEATL
jgi:hypothetical protein